MFKLSQDNSLGQELRMCVVDSLKDLMEQDDTIIALDADVGAASGWTKLKSMYPNQFINVGISEANMVGLAAGLSMVGHTPFIHTFGPFATRRVFDQLFISGGYSNNNINIYGSDPGFAAGANGGTHTTWEDIALIRMIPHSTICDAADTTQMEWVIKEFGHRKGINYVRGNRKSVKNVYEKGSTFEIGKGNKIHNGKDVLIISAGQLVSDVLIAVKELEENDISCEVIDMFTIKPLDKTLILSEVKGKKLIVTVENHSINNGLGSSISEVLSENGVGIPLYRVGVEERFGQVGSQDYLQQEFGLDANSIKDKVREQYLKITK